MPNIGNMPIPQQVKDKLQNLGIAEEDINNETVVLYSLFTQAIQGNVSAITQVQKLFNDKEEEPERPLEEYSKEELIQRCRMLEDIKKSMAYLVTLKQKKNIK